MYGGVCPPDGAGVGAGVGVWAKVAEAGIASAAIKRDKDFMFASKLV